MAMKRRWFLVIAAAAIGLAYGFFRSWHSLKVFLKGPEKTADPVKKHTTFRNQDKFLVAAVGGRDIKNMVREAVRLLGKGASLDLQGKKVLVKPNVVGERSNPTTTNPEVVKAVVELLYQEGAGKVYVGDMSALVRGGTEKNMEQTGILSAARDAGAECVFFEDHGWVNVTVKSKYVREVDVTEWFFNVDRVINLPVLKTHRYAGYSISLKNFVGATHFSQRPYLVDRDHWEEVVAELNLAFTPDLNIVDGTKTMISGGPWQGQTANTNLILASGDRVACDVVGLGIIKSFGQWERLRSTSPWDMRQVKRATEVALGARTGEEIELVTKSLNNDPAFSRLMGKVRDFSGISAG